MKFLSNRLVNCLTFNIIVVLGVAYADEYYVCQQLDICTNRISSTLADNFGNWPSPSICGTLRESLECVFNVAPHCTNKNIKTILGPSPSGSDSSQETLSHLSQMSSSSSTQLPGSQLTALIDKTKRFFEAKCENNREWQNSDCFKSSSLSECNQLSFKHQINPSNCRDFLKHRSCITKLVKSKCPLEDLLYLNFYLFDKAANLTLHCNSQYNYLFNYTSSSYNEPESVSRLARVPSTNDDSSRMGEYYPFQVIYPPYSVYPASYPGDRLRPVADDSHIHGHKYPHYSGRDIYPGPYPTRVSGQWQFYPSRPGMFDFDNCLEKVKYLTRSCEESLMHSQRVAKTSDTPQEIQRDLCCALVNYRQCIYRITERVCPSLVNYIFYAIIPYSRRQEIEGCRSYTMFLCASAANANLMCPMLGMMLISALTVIMSSLLVHREI